jgi:hypothetical protein
MEGRAFSPDNNSASQPGLSHDNNSNQFVRLQPLKFLTAILAEIPQ